ncbi:BRO family protein [Gordonia sp. AC31]|uniref:BRO family protein n=1 Tax=Gordonia sp. AC31 TaxID=2962571 RepID=UPI00288213C5|nr:BRO family protein [Gordonia sp. AC31]MDT0223506.1 phage antirepressor Ant [Gordonia sp. AC31]
MPHNITPHDGDGSPFDAIRRVTPEGREYWSARDLMPMLGYDEWRKFDGAIDRARISASNAGYIVSDHFVGAAKVAASGPAAKDHHLSRYACYLIALNGDPRKPEIASAQNYFVIKTREAETATHTLGDPLDELELANNRVAKAVEIARGERIRAEKAERKLAVEEKHRKAIEGGDGIDPTTFGKKYFSDVRKTDFDAHLYDHGYLINQRNTRVRPDGEVRDGYDHRKPTAKGRRYFYPHDNGNHGGRRRFTPRVRPQMEIALRDALAAEGLPVNEHSTGLVLLTSDDMKELGA